MLGLEPLLLRPILTSGSFRHGDEVELSCIQGRCTTTELHEGAFSCLRSGHQRDTVAHITLEKETKCSKCEYMSFSWCLVNVFFSLFISSPNYRWSVKTRNVPDHMTSGEHSMSLYATVADS